MDILIGCSLKVRFFRPRAARGNEPLDPKTIQARERVPSQDRGFRFAGSDPTETAKRARAGRESGAHLALDTHSDDKRARAGRPSPTSRTTTLSRVRLARSRATTGDHVAQSTCRQR